VLKGAGVIKKVRPGFFIATGATVPTAKELMDTCTSYSVQKRTKREQKNTSVSNAVAPEEKVKIEHHGQVQIPLVVPAQPKKTDRDILIENINQAAYSKGHTQNEVLSAMASILHDNGWKLERPVFSTVPFKPE
jgi:cytochrome c oxidase assembly protein Cox11